jgi:hypothetical protein
MNKNKIKIGFRYLFILAAVITTLSAPAVFAQTTATTSSGIQAVANTFSDVPRTHQYYTAIAFMNSSGVISGYSDGTFKSENSINRAEVLKVILKGSNIGTDQAFSADFPDITADQWFALYVIKAKALGLVKGNDVDGTFAPARQVNLAEFVKMLLLANKIDVSSFQGKTVAPNISPDAWYANYINYAAALGILPKDAQGNVDASKPLTRGEVVNIMYLLSIIRNGKDTQFLLNRAEAELAQIEVYIAANQVGYAKNSSELAVDMTQQAYKNMPTNAVVVGAAKIARAYDLLVDAFVLGVQGKKEESANMANQAIGKATEAWEANNATQPIAKHIKDRAREILAQVGGTEN